MSFAMAAAAVVALAAMAAFYGWMLRTWSRPLLLLAVAAPLSQCLLLAFYAALTFVDPFFKGGLGIVAALSLLCLLADGIALPFFRRAQTKELEEQRARAAVVFADASERSACLLREETREAAAVCGEMAMRLREAAQLASSGDREALKRRLGELGAPAALGAGFCANRVADALLALKEAAAAQASVAFSVDADIPDGLAVADADLCAALANMIDNALRGAAAARGPARFVSVRARLGRKMLAIEVENGIDVVADASGASRRRRVVGGHGWGLEILRDIAERYDGSFEAKAEGDRWRATCMLRAL